MNYKNKDNIGAKPKAGVVKTMPGLVKRFGKLGFWHGFRGKADIITKNSNASIPKPVVKPPVAKPPVEKPKK